MLVPTRPTGPPQLRLFGVPVRIEPMFFLIVPLLGLGLVSEPGLFVGWVVIVGASILLHELGHAAAFIAFGSRPAIVLHGFGGLTFAARPRKRWQSVVVSLTGPVLPLVTLGLPSAYLAGSAWAAESDARLVLVHMVTWVNLWWGLVNLLPLLPLDGGHVAEQFLGPTAARVLTIVVAVPIGAYAWTQELPFAAILAGVCALQAYQQLRTSSVGRARIDVVRPSRATAAEPPHAAAVRAALSARPDDPWWQGAAELIDERTVAALARFEAAALSGPPPGAVVAMLGDEGLAPRLAERLLSRPGPRSPVAVAEVAGGLLAAGRHGAAALVAERLAADGRDAALTAWAAGAAAEAWAAAGDPARAERWRRRADELG